VIAGTLEIQIAADIARLTTGMDAAQSVVSRAMGNINRTVGATKQLLETLGVSLSVGYFAHLIEESIDAADHLNDLSKTTGIAVEDLAGLKLLAQQTGTDLDSLAKGAGRLSVEMGKAPEKFRALGVTATDAVGQLKQLADIFNLLPDISQRNALAQAVFGKSWQELAPLLSEGSQKMQEAIEKGAQLSGVTTAMAQASDEFNDKLAELTGTHGLLNRQVSTLLPLLNVLADTVIDLRGSTAQLDADGFHPLAEAFRQVILFGGNVAFVLHGIGVEVGALAAQLAAGGPFTAAGRAIHELAVKDAEEARAKFDAWEKKIMSTATSLQVVGDTSDALSRKLAVGARAEQDAAAARVKAFLDSQNAIKDAASAYDSLLKRLNERIDLDKRQLELGRPLTDQEKLQIKVESDLAEIKKKYPAASKETVAALLQEISTHELNIQVQNSELDLARQIAAQRQAEKNTDYAQSAAGVQAITDAWAAQLKTVKDSIQAEQDEMEAMRLVVQLNVTYAEAIQMVTIARLRDQQSRATVDGEAYKALQDQIDARLKLLGLLQDRESWQTQLDLIREVSDLGKTLWDDLWSGGHNVLQKLGQDIKKFLLDELYELVVKKWVVNIAAQVTGGIGSVLGLGGSAATSGAGSGLGLGALLGPQLSGFLSVAGLGAGFGAGLGALFGFKGSQMTTAAIGGALLGGIPGAILGALVKPGGGPKTESGYGVGVPSRGDPTAAAAIAQAIAQGFTPTAQALGLTADKIQSFVNSIGVFIGQDPQGDAQTQLQVIAGGYNRGTLTGGGALGENVGRDPAALQAATQLAVAQALVKGLQDAAGGAVGDFLKSIDIASASLDTLNNALQVAQDVGILTQALSGLGPEFANLAALSVQSQEALAQAAGGVANLTAELGGYYNDFLTDAQKHDAMLAGLTQTFAAANVQLPQSRDAFIAMFKAAEAAGDTSTLAILLKTENAFNQLYPAIDAVGTAADDAAQAAQAAAEKQQQIDQTRKQLQDQIWQAEGNTAALRKEELDALTALDPSLAAMQQHLYDLQDRDGRERRAHDETSTATRQKLISSYSDEVSALQQTASQAPSVCRQHRSIPPVAAGRQPALGAQCARGASAAAQSNFEDIAARAKAGDASAQQQLQAAATSYLQNARSMFGLGELHEPSSAKCSRSSSKWASQPMGRRRRRNSNLPRTRRSSTSSSRSTTARRRSRRRWPTTRRQSSRR
jgi:hypothetical protein